MNLLEKYKEIYALEPTTVGECGVIKFLAEKFPENFEYALVDRNERRFSAKDFRQEHNLTPILIIKDFKEWIGQQTEFNIELDGDAFTGTGTMTYGTMNASTGTFTESKKEEETAEE